MRTAGSFVFLALIALCWFVSWWFVIPVIVVEAVCAWQQNG